MHGTRGICHPAHLLSQPADALVQYTVCSYGSAQAQGIAGAGGGGGVKDAIVARFSVKVLRYQFPESCALRFGNRRSTAFERTQPWIVVGGRCAFSARNLNLAREPPRDMPMTSPTNAAVGGRMSRLRGRWIDILDVSDSWSALMPA